MESVYEPQNLLRSARNQQHRDHHGHRYPRQHQQHQQNHQQNHQPPFPIDLSSQHVCQLTQNSHQHQPQLPVRNHQSISPNAQLHHHEQLQNQRNHQQQIAGPKSGFQPKNPSLGGKDLIIRMLAEVFQVVRSESNGQLRWQQLSSSLIPISLYSRTTGKWLDYLTAASSLDSNQEQSAMSPDSRQFLLLLQQIHHQQQQQQQQMMQHTNHIQNQPDARLSDGSNIASGVSGNIVFQVIAQDLVDGNQCKVILNAKLCQPGTRIGQASDYFVYWRDSPTGSSQQQITSTTAPFSPTMPSCCTAGSSRIWGLNFASINDANLFYDICSLNLTDLDFNHEYLKQLIGKNRMQIASCFSRNFNQSQHKQESSLGLQHQHKQNVNMTTAKQPYAPTSGEMNLETARCVACKEILGFNKSSQAKVMSNSLHEQQVPSSEILTHAKKRRVVQKQSSANGRFRSRSTGRIADQQQTEYQEQEEGQLYHKNPQHQHHQQLAKKYNCKEKVNNSLKRSQSLSTRTTPEKSDHKENLKQQQQVCDTQHSSRDQVMVNPKPGAGENIDGDKQQQQALGPSPIDLLAEIQFPTSNRIATRRSTGIDSRNIRDINMNLSNCQRRARMAREQYANSKHLNEFLSLDLANATSTNVNKPDGQQTANVNQLSTPNKCNNDQKLSGDQPSISKSVKSDLQTRHPSGSGVENPINSNGEDKSKNHDRREAATTTEDLQLELGVKMRMFSELTNNLPVGRKDDFNGTVGQRTDVSARRRSLERSFGMDMEIPSVSKGRQTKLSPSRRSRSSLVTPEARYQNELQNIDDASGPVPRQPVANKQQSIKKKTSIKQQQASRNRQRVNLREGQSADGELRLRARSSGDATLRKLHVSTRQLQPEENYSSGNRRANTRPICRDHLSQANSAPNVHIAPAEIDHSAPYYPCARSIYYQQSNMDQYYGQDATFESSSHIEMDPEEHQFMQQQLATRNRACLCDQINYAQSCPSSLRRRKVNAQSRSFVGNQLASTQILSCCKRHHDNRANFDSISRDNPIRNVLRETVDYVNPNRMLINDRLRALEQRGQLHYRPLACEPDYEGDEQYQYNHQYHHQSNYKSPGSCHNDHQSCSSNMANVRSPSEWAYSHNGYGQDMPVDVDFRYNHLNNHSGNAIGRSHRSRSSGYTDDKRLLSTMRHEDPIRDYCHDGRSWSRPQSACIDSREANYHSFTQPVANYDKCLNRQALRARPRARSQPPHNANQQETQRGSSTAAQSTATILAKSMENVQKLINEVQFELDSFKLQSKDSFGASIDKNFIHDESNRSAMMNDGTCNNRPQQQYISTNSKILANNSKKSGLNDINEANNEQQQKLIKQVINMEEQQRRHLEPMVSPMDKPSEYKCVGAMRKAGFLNAKKWLNNMSKTIQLARGKAWRRYWITLRGTVLLIHYPPPENVGNASLQIDEDFHSKYIDLYSWIKLNCCDQQQLLIENLYHQWLTTGSNTTTEAYLGQQLDQGFEESSSDKQEAHQQQTIGLSLNGNDNRMQEFISSYLCREYIECTPRHMIIIDGSIAQPMPEHPRREHVFCLSTRFGDAFLFQANSALESDNWIFALHNACAASLARNLTRAETVKLFETRIRNLEMEAEKLLFLRQRLESRLTSMLSINREQPQQQQQETADQLNNHDDITSRRRPVSSESPVKVGQLKDLTMRDLLHKLEEQMIELDRLLEQIHCEIYQLRCYLAACNSVYSFYSHLPKSISTGEGKKQPQLVTDLPDPRNLLKNVSKHTKMLLLNLGVFMVSSIQAYIHARQGSAETIIRRIRWEHERVAKSPNRVRLLELDFLSMSLGDTELTSRKELNRLDRDAQKLIELTNLTLVKVKIAFSLYNHIVGADISSFGPNWEVISNAAGCCISAEGTDWICLVCEVYELDTTMSILRKLFKILLHTKARVQETNANEPETMDANLVDDGSEFLEYYLIVHKLNSTHNIGVDTQNIAKRSEQVRNWRNHLKHLELRRRKRFEVQLNRSSTASYQDSDSIPFGLLLEAQLFPFGEKNILSVYCSFVEWRSEAESKGLLEEDEIISINGIRTVHLDMMFIEWLMSQERQLQLVISSSHDIIRSENEPVGQSPLNKHPDEGGDVHHDATIAGDGDILNINGQSSTQNKTTEANQYESKTDKRRIDSINHDDIADGTNVLESAANRIIDDAYVSGLICPPPPSANNRHRRSVESKHQSSIIQSAQGTVIGAPPGPEVERIAATAPTLASIGKSELSIYGRQNNPSPTKRYERHQHQFVNQQVMTTSNQILCSSRSSETISRPDSEFNSDIVDLPQSIESTAKCTLKSGFFMEPVSTTAIETNCYLLAEETNKLERVRKSIMELIITEFSYIIQLEEMLEFFIRPLSESNYLNIRSLKNLGEIIMSLPNLHKKFLFNIIAPMNNQLADIQPQPKLTTQSNNTNPSNYDTNSLEILVDQVRDKLSQARSLTSISQCGEIVRLITDTFKQESERLKNYASYSVAYSHLQRILHPKMHALQSQQSLTNPKYEPVTQQHQSNPLDLLLKGGRNLRDSISLSSMSNADQHDDSKVKHKLVKFLANLEKENNSLSVSSGSLKCSPASRSLNEQEATSGNGHQVFVSTPSSNAPTNLISLAQMGSESMLSGKQFNFGQISSGHNNAITGAGHHQKHQQQQRSGFIHQQSFESYLIRPVQRIVRYPMLLKTILVTHQECLRPKTSPEPDGPDADLPFEPVLRETIKLMESVASHVNQVQQIYDQFGDLFDTLRQEYLDGQLAQNNNSGCSKAPYLGGNNILTNSRRQSHQPIIELNSEHLLHFGQINWLNWADFMSSKQAAKNNAMNAKNMNQMLFVFESCVVLICHDKLEPNLPSFGAVGTSKSRRSTELIRYQTLIPVSQVQVRTLSEHHRDNLDDHCATNKNEPSTMNSDQQRRQSLINSLSGVGNENEGFRWELICCQFNSSELLLQTSKKRSQAINNFATNSASVNQNNAGGSTRDQRKGKVYLFVSKTSEERNIFLKKIRQTIRDSVSKMSLPLTRNQLADIKQQQHQDENSPTTPMQQIYKQSMQPNDCPTNKNRLDLPPCESMNINTNNDTATVTSTSNTSSSKKTDDLGCSSSSNKKSAGNDEAALTTQDSSTTFHGYRNTRNNDRNTKQTNRCSERKKAEIIA